jgi:hypothetical protein
MNMHKNARLTPSGRALLASRVESGWTVKAAAVAAGVSERTAHKWLGRIGSEASEGITTAARRRGDVRAGPLRTVWLE